MSFFLKFQHSMVSPKKIIYNNLHSLKGAIGYLVIITLTIGLLVSLSLTLKITAGSVESIQNYIKYQLPKFEIKNGFMVTEDNQNFRDDFNEIELIIDLDNTFIIDEKVKESLMYVLAKKERMSIHIGRIQFVFDYKDYKDQVIQNQEVANYFEVFKYTRFIFVPILVCLYFIGSLFSALFLSFFATLLAKARGIHIKFNILYAMAIYALTVPIILDAGAKLANIHSGAVIFIYYMIGYFYMSMVLTEYMKKNKML